MIPGTPPTHQPLSPSSSSSSSARMLDYLKRVPLMKRILSFSNSDAQETVGAAGDRDAYSPTPA